MDIWVSEFTHRAMEEGPVWFYEVHLVHVSVTSVTEVRIFIVIVLQVERNCVQTRSAQVKSEKSAFLKEK